MQQNLKDKNSSEKSQRVSESVKISEEVIVGEDFCPRVTFTGYGQFYLVDKQRQLKNSSYSSRGSKRQDSKGEGRVKI